MLSFLRTLIPHDFPLRLWWHRGLTWIAAWSYGFPARDMTVIGVTGTDGKTTTCTCIYEILKRQGLHVGLATTIRFAIGDEEWTNETHKTTLGRFYLQQLLYKMKQKGCTHLVLEVSSHALEQGRILGIPIDIALITNITHEHLDYHKTMEAYIQAKMKLFELLSTTRRKENQPKIAIANLDDPSFQEVLGRSADQHILFSLEKQHPTIQTYQVDEIIYEPSETRYTVMAPGGKHFELITPLLGRHNIQNTLLASIAALQVGCDIPHIYDALKSMQQIPGRFENLTPESEFAVILDYALTENACTALYQTAQSIVKSPARIISVFGACGDRDQSKRPHIGRIASEYCDIVIITDDEPYTEDPASIRAMIREGVDRNQCEVYEIPDREKAILMALELAEAGDMVLLSGMGDQTSRIFGMEKIAWSEREVVKKLMLSLGK